MATAAGPQGTGLIPPGTQGTRERGSAQDEEQEPPAPPRNEPESPPEDDIDGVPPVDDQDPNPDDDQDDDGDDDGQAPDLNELENRILDQVQRRFDRAISKALKGVEDRLAANGSGPGDEDEDEDEEDPPPPPPRQRNRQPQVDTRTLMVLARDRVADAMEDAGKAERIAAKEMLDRVIPAVDWSRVDDEDEFIGDLISTFSSHAAAMVKAGSDRKVRQLRQMGLIPENDGQPGGPAGGARNGRETPGDRMAQGQNRAAARWPDGKRRMGS